MDEGHGDDGSWNDIHFQPCMVSWHNRDARIATHFSATKSLTALASRPAQKGSTRLTRFSAADFKEPHYPSVYHVARQPNGCILVARCSQFTCALVAWHFDLDGISGMAT